MEKKEVINMDELDPRFIYEIASQSGGEHIMKCVQCATCSSGCPVAFLRENACCAMGGLVREHRHLYEGRDFENERKEKLSLPRIGEEKKEISVIHRCSDMNRVMYFVR